MRSIDEPSFEFMYNVFVCVEVLRLIKTKLISQKLVIGYKKKLLHDEFSFF